MEKKEKIQGDNKLNIKQDKSYFHSNTFNNFTSTDVKDLISKSNREIIESISNYQEVGTGWYFKKIDKLEIHTTEFKPIKSGCQRKPGKMLKMSTEGGQQNKFIRTSQIGLVE